MRAANSAARCACRLSALPEVAGELGSTVDDTLPYRLEQLLASVQNLPRQRALAAREDAARARLGVERGNRNPDVTVGVHAGREGPSDGREHLAIVSLSLPLPLFKRNDAAIGQAMTDMTQAEVERAAALRDAEVRVRQLWSRLASQRERIARLQRVLVPASTDNQQLSARVARGRTDRPARPAARQPPGDRRRTRPDRPAGRDARHPNRTRIRGRLAATRKRTMNTLTKLEDRRLRAGLARCRAAAGLRAGRLRQSGAKDEHAGEGDKHAEHAGEKKEGRTNTAKPNPS